MLPSASFNLPAECDFLAAGALLRGRMVSAKTATHLESGRVVFGVCEDGQMRHQFGVVEGPTWLDASAAVLGLPSLVDMVAETEVRLRRMPLDEFRSACAALPPPVRTLLHDMALSQRQQTELALSRLAQDAGARCAQWLLRHAEHEKDGTWRVTLHQRKRLIAAQLGIAPETFSRVLRNLRELGLIAGSGSVLDLPQPAALRAVAGG
ncbi:Crp/Fnr family transcriptional regulator [Ramlibacter sp. H39-3-26]|uniref:Crp/Fnr family transcriptional regulator n=1 Tax=Curvibacter soli TaxID=3031331 RepID=UPI0023DB9841|nr:Crp/Fnr family transcriptional regulator [Ramlibacter sp. H39-3-26]MDF1486645.1 Crp/Fnr family transcriptional regulator [Ramlibacter sp. H39-3-26]